jgi:protein disulfide-isomerase A6
MFVPHILDTGALGRNDLLELYGTIALKFRTQPFTFVWSESGAQSSLENSLNINAVYPSIAVMSYEKKMFAVNRISWSKKNIETFLNGVLSGGYVLINFTTCSTYSTYLCNIYTVVCSSL